MTPRPTALPVRVEGIPDVLKAEVRWVVWKYEWRDGRWTKMQYQAFGSAGAKSNDPTTWTTFANALAAYRLNRFDGISFALGDGYGGIDVDNYLSHATAWPIFCAAYRETSPSGTGIKIIGRAARIGGEIKFAPHAETPICTTWMRPRFFTITGQDSSGDPTTDIAALIAVQFAAPAAPPATRDGYRDSAVTSDDDLLLQMIGTDTVGDKILALWRGDLSAHGGDHSRADQALCCHLAFWTNYDAERIDRLFRQSSLMRAKWDTDSYRRATLGKATR